MRDTNDGLRRERSFLVLAGCGHLTVTDTSEMQILKIKTIEFQYRE